MPEIRFDQFEAHVDERVLDIVGRVAFGLLAATRMNATTYDRIGTAIEGFQMPRHRLPSLARAREDYESWVLQQGLTSLIDEVNHLLEEARKAFVAVRRAVADDGPTTPDEWTAALSAGATAYHSKGLPVKLRDLAKLLPGFVEPPHAAMLVSINDARACVVHRRGVVTDRDLNSPDALTVSWEVTRIMFKGPHDKSFRSSHDGPIRTRVGETVGVDVRVDVVPAAKAFRLHERVTFTAAEFASIGLTIGTGCKALIHEIDRFLAELDRSGESPG